MHGGKGDGMRKPVWLVQRLHEPDRTATAFDRRTALCMQYLKTLNVRSMERLGVMVAEEPAQAPLGQSGSLIV